MAENSLDFESQLNLEYVKPIKNEGGYPLDVIIWLEDKPDDYTCRMCNLLFREPMQRECGHRACKICLEKDPKVPCPDCMEDMFSCHEVGLPTVSMLDKEVSYSHDYFLRRRMDRLPAQCRYPNCDWIGTFKEYRYHCLKCDWLPLECSQCHMKDIPLHMFDDHQQENCTKMIPCPLDCGNQVSERELPDHVQKDLYSHLLNLKSMIIPKDTPAENQFPKEYNERLDKVDQIIGVLQDDMKKFTQLLVNGIKEREALAIKINKMTMDCYNGIFLWRVDDFEKRRQEAISGSCTSIYSVPFYTDHFGYKMCLRLYLNGDGVGKGKMISLFIVVMQGQYDAVISWPFKQRVTLMMLDQVESKHVVDTFRPDSKSSSFQRPKQKMNIASGCPSFFPIDRLNSQNNYVRNNTAFFKVVVDSAGLEKMAANFMPT